MKQDRDALRWSALGIGWQARSRSAGLRTQLDELLAAFPPAGPVDHRLEVTRRVPVAKARLLVDGECVEVAPRASRLLEGVLHYVDLHTARDAERLMLHAGAVEYDGGVVAFPGGSGAGKSTLTAALVRGGFRYVSDEIVAVVPSTRLVEPYPRPIALSRGSWPLFPDLEPVARHTGPRRSPTRWLVAPRQLGVVAEPAPIRSIVFPTYRADGPTRLEPISRATALYELCAQTLYFDRHGRAALDLLDAIVRDADCYRLAVGDLGTALAVTAEVAGGRVASS